MPLNIPQHTGQPPTTKNDLVQNVSTAETQSSALVSPQVSWLQAPEGRDSDSFLLPTGTWQGAGCQYTLEGRDSYFEEKYLMWIHLKTSLTCGQFWMHFYRTQTS